MDLKLLYMGIDNRYWRRLKEEFISTYEKEMDFEFKEVDDSLLRDYRSLLRIAMDEAPSVIFLDFATQSESLIKLVTLLRRINATKNIVLIGLFSANEFPRAPTGALTAGILLNQLKGADDFQDVIFNSITLVNGEKAKEPGFYKLAFRNGDETFVTETCRVNFISKESVHIETYLEHTVGQAIDLRSLIPQDVVPSCHFSIKQVEGGPLYYNSKQASILQFEYADRLVPSGKKITKLDEAKLNDDKEKRNGDVKKIKASLDEWIKKSLTTSSPKKIKILIVEQFLRIIEQGEKWIWDYPYSFRLQTHIDNPEKELKSYLPNFIAIDVYHPPALPENEKAGKPVPEVNQVFVRQMIAAIKNIPHYNPFLFIFNLDMKSEMARETFGYDKLIVDNKQIQFESIIKLAEIFEQKGKFFTAQHTKELLYISKYEPMSFAYINHPIKIKTISECEMVFECVHKIPLNTHLFLELPAKFYVTVIPHSKMSQAAGGANCYRGLIHSQNLEEKNKLRKFIIAKSKD